LAEEQLSKLYLDTLPAEWQTQEGLAEKVEAD